MSIRRRTRKRSINKKHNRKTRISKKTRNNKGYVGGGHGCSKMATVVPRSGPGYYSWWKQSIFPTGTGYPWEKYNDEDTGWLNGRFILYLQQRRDDPILSLFPNDSNDFIFDFMNLIQIRLADGEARKIMYTDGDTPPIEPVPYHPGFAGLKALEGAYVNHPWNKLIGRALQVAKMRGVVGILSDENIEEFSKIDSAPPPPVCYRPRIPPRQLPGGGIARHPYPIDSISEPVVDSPPPLSAMAGQRRRPRRVKPDEGPAVASLASPLASPPSYQRVMENLAKYPSYDPARHKSK